MKEMEFYRCGICGNMAALIKSGGGELICCGQPMTKLKANTTDASTEKHVPAVTYDNGKIKVTVGSVPHPMAAEHYIEWIALVTDDKFEIAYLKPGMESKAEFTYEAGEKEVLVYEYCNLHGLWQAKLETNK